MDGFQGTVFFDPLYSSYQLNKELSWIGGIDDSHNHKHAKEVLFWAQEIIKNVPQRLYKRDLLMIGQCCLLHDLMDRKYTDFSDQVAEHLDRFHPIHETELMLKVMKTMSYSKTVFEDSVVFPEWLQDSPFDNVYHITREADLLAAYNTARMIEFRRAKHGDLSFKEVQEEVMNLYDKRISKMISKGLFINPSSKEIAKHLHAVAEYKIKLVPNLNSFQNLDILRIVNHLSIYDLVREMDSIPCVSV